MRVKALFTTLIYLAICQGGMCQIELEEQPEVQKLMDDFVKIGKEEPYIEGWRIKVISTTDRRELERARGLFRWKYPEIKARMKHESPHYSLIVGAFETRFDVEPYLVLFKQDFPLTIPYRDKIVKSELFEQTGF